MNPDHETEFNNTPPPSVQPPGSVFQPGAPAPTTPETPVVQPAPVVTPTPAPPSVVNSASGASADIPPPIVPTIPEPVAPLSPDSLAAIDVNKLSTQPVVTATVIQPQRGRGILFGLLTAIAALVVAGALGYLFYLRPALAAYHRAANRLGTAKSVQVDGSVKLVGTDFLASYNTDMKFTGALDRSGKTAAQLKFDGSWAKRDYQGETQLQNNRLSFRLKADPMPVIRYKQSAVLVPLKSQQAYSLKADATLWDNVCENRIPATPATQLELYRQLRSTKVKTSWWMNPRARHEGQVTTSFTGQLPTTQLVQLTAAIQAAMPPGCGFGTFGLTAQDINHIQVSYQLWTSATDDWVEVRLKDKSLGTQLTLNLHGSHYNEASSGLVPLKPIIDLNAVYSQAAKSAGLKP